MLAFISDNAATIIISAVVLAVIVIDIIYLVRQRKKGKHICSGCCENCGRCGK